MNVDWKRYWLFDLNASLSFFQPCILAEISIKWIAFLQPTSDIEHKIIEKRPLLSAIKMFIFACSEVHVRFIDWIQRKSMYFYGTGHFRRGNRLAIVPSATVQPKAFSRANIVFHFKRVFLVFKKDLTKFNLQNSTVSSMEQTPRQSQRVVRKSHSKKFSFAYGFDQFITFRVFLA